MNANFDKFPTLFVYWMKIEYVVLFLSKLDEKNCQVFNFPAFGLAEYAYKIAAVARPSCGEVGTKFSKQELSCLLI